MSKINKDQKSVNRILNDIRTKLFSKDRLEKLREKGKASKLFTVEEKVFIKWYISTFISEQVFSGTKTFKTRRTWDIKVFHSLETFKRNLNVNTKELDDDERMIYVITEIFILKSYLDNENVSAHNGLMDSVSMYYRECFMNGREKGNQKTKIKAKTLFSSNKRTLTVDFISNVITLVDNDKVYHRDIILEELNIFPNLTLRHQFIG